MTGCTQGRYPAGTRQGTVQYHTLPGTILAGEENLPCTPPVLVQAAKRPSLSSSAYAVRALPGPSLVQSVAHLKVGALQPTVRR